jgi:hypothetical protein
VPTDEFTPDQCDDDDVVAELAAKVKDTIAGKIGELLAERGPAFGDRLPGDQETAGQETAGREAAGQETAGQEGGDGAAAAD